MINYNQLLGNYNTTFFSVHLFDDNISTYVHEYVHHIQNITTPYGLTYYSSRLIYLLHEFNNNPSSHLYNLVSKLWKSNKKMIRKTIKQVGTAINLEYNNCTVEDLIIISNKKHFDRYGVKIIDAVKIKLKVNESLYEIPFMVRMIKENMARLIQKKCFPQSIISKNVTYYLIEDVIKKYSPDFPVNAQTVVALCDISLIADSPVHAFYSFLAYFKQFDSNKITARFMYESVQKEKIYALVGSFDIIELLERQLNICLNAIDAFYISFDSQAHIRDWIKEICRKGIEFRKNNFSFVCDIMDSNISTLEAQSIFLNIVKNLGFTVERNSDGQFSIPNNITPTDFVKLIALEEYTNKKLEEKSGRSSPCNLRNFCEKYVRNDTISVGYGICSIKTVQTKDLNVNIDSISNPVINDTCYYPMHRDMYNNLCPFTYVRRKIQQMNQ